MTEKQKEGMKEIATQLLDLFGPDGKHWIRNDLEDGKGNYCLLGGIQHIGMENKSDLLADAIREHTNQTWDSVPDFNDAHYWPTIKEFLMHYAHPYQPKEKRNG